ncbi:MAG: 1-acyl-sn-glycerol-3-phosphate acyltransferase [Acetobacteraceae bacterium]|nr:1-acyl-sn-glycerol-3-phosphate acyltransferase [Acetobacteraceae bacterium]
MVLVRSLVFNLIFFAGTALASALVLPFALGSRPRVLAMMRAWGRCVLVLLRAICGIELRVLGRDHLPASGAALIAAKHQSAFDTIVWFTLLPAPAYVMKQELFRIPLYGWLARAAGHIGVDREAGARAMRGLLRAGQQAAAEGRQVVIFPEGTRTAPGERRAYQPGVAALAAAMKAPVIPVATDSGRFWGRRSFLKRPGVLTVSVLPPLPHGLGKDALLGAIEDAIEAEQARLGA